MWDLSLWRTGFSLVVVCSFSLSSCGVWAPGHVGSVVVAHGLSCPAACGILVPRAGMEPASPALEGEFFTTGPRVKSLDLLILFYLLFILRFFFDVDHF